MFTSNSFYFDEKLLSPGTGIRGAIKIELKDALDRNSDFLKEEARRNSGNMKIYENMKIQRINYGYRRFHPLYGVEHIIQLTIKTENKVRLENSGKTQQISTSRNRWFHTQLPFGHLLHNVDPLAVAPSYVHFLVPLEGRLETFRRFMNNVEEVCLKPRLLVKPCGTRCVI